jgi:hypothetical protein
MTFRFAHLLTGVLLVSATLAAQAPTPQEKIATLKQALADSAKSIRQYQWTETTSISMKGEEKSKLQNTVVYGADGKLQKTPLNPPAPKAEAKTSRRDKDKGDRLKENIVENKKEEISDYMKQAVALIQSYVPPKPEQIQAAQQAGNMTVQGGKIEFKDYLKPKDLMTIEIDPSGKRLSKLSVASYIEKPDEPVTLNVVFGALEDGTSYTQQTTLDAKAKNIKVVVSNGGYKKISQ